MGAGQMAEQVPTKMQETTGIRTASPDTVESRYKKPTRDREVSYNGVYFPREILEGPGTVSYIEGFLIRGFL